MQTLIESDADLSERARNLLLASAAASYPDAEQLACLRDQRVALERLPELAAFRRALFQGADTLPPLHTRLYDVSKERTSLYETEYGRMRGMAKGRDLADISGFYLAFGVQPGADGSHELVDHIAVELEFYALLLIKQAALDAAGDAEGVAVVREARGSFLRDHLGRFASAIALQGTVAADPIYGPVFRWIAALVAAECALLDVDPPPLDFFAADGEPDQVSCGSGVCIPRLGSGTPAGAGAMPTGPGGAG